MATKTAKKPIVKKAVTKPAAKSVAKPTPAPVKSPQAILSTILQQGTTKPANPAQPLPTQSWAPSYSNTPQQEAESKVNLQYGAQTKALERARQQAAQDYARQQATQKSYGDLIDPRLEKIYAALGNSLTQNRQDTSAGYQSAVDKIRGYYEQSGQANQRVNTDLQSGVQNFAEKLGLGAAVPAGTEKLNSDYQFAQTQNNQAGAGQQANLQEYAAKIFGLDTGRIGAAAQEGAQQRAQAQTGVLAAIQQLGQGAATDNADYLQQIADLESEKPDALQQFLSQIESQRNQESMAGRQNALQEMLARAGLQNEAAGNTGAIAESLARLGQDQSQFQQTFGENQRQFNAQLGVSLAKLSQGGSGAAKNSFNPNDPLDVARLASLMKGLNKKDPIQPGPAGLQGFLKNLKTPGGKGAGPKFSGAVQDIITRASELTETALRDKSIGKPVGSTKEYDIALRLANAKEYPGLNASQLKQAIQAYYQGIK